MILPLRILGVTALLFSVVLRAAVARGTEPTEAEVERARDYFAQAQELGEKGAWAEAAAKLQSALEIKETPGLRFHLAHAFEQQGRLLEARVEYDRAAELIESGVSAADVAALLVDARRRLRERIPTVRVVVDPPVADAQVWVDERSAEGSEPVPLDPGSHLVRVSAPAREAFETQLEVTEGDRRVVHASLPAVPSQTLRATPAEAAPAPGQKGMGARGAVLTAEGLVTLAAVGLGIYFKVQEGAAANSASDLADVVESEGPHACADPASALETTCKKLREELEREMRSHNAAVGSFIGAGVGAAGFLATLLLWSPEEPERTARVHVEFARRGVFSSVTGRF